MPVFRLDFTGYGSDDINLGGMKHTVYHTTVDTKEEALKGILFRTLPKTAKTLIRKLLPYVNDIVTEVPPSGRILKKKQIDLFGSIKRLSIRDGRN